MQKINTSNFNLFSPENERAKIQLGISKIKKALHKLNNPCFNIPAIQIVGTNGKGSIAAFIENIICSMDINVGVTTSPHIFDINERIRFNKTKIKKDELDKYLKIIQKELSEFNLSPFELIICSSLTYFHYKKASLLVLEAGLGGRLDATTAHHERPIIAIGKIDIDHAEYLGNSIKDIAIEKAAVIEKDSTVISCTQCIEVKNIIKERISEVGAKIHWVKPLSKKWELGLKGDFQRENAAVALGVIEVLYQKGWNIKKKLIKKSLADTKWPGRMEIIIWENKEILVDSAHNPSGAKVLANERKNWDNQEKGIYWIIGVQKQKNIKDIINNLRDPKDKFLLVPIPNQKSWTIEEISTLSEFNYDHIFEFKDLKYALDYLKRLKRWPECHPVLTGSIFLVSEFLKLTI